MDPWKSKFTLPLAIAACFAIFAMGCSDDPITPGTSQPTPNPPSIFDWTLQQTEESASFKDIFFINASSGWAVGDEIVIATSNGGASWPFVPVNSLPAKLNSISFIDMDRGWMVGGESGSQTGEVFISQQGGAYPEVQKTVENSLNTVFFLQNGSGWAAGENGLILNTLDGGANWSPLSIEGNPRISDLHFWDNQNGWAVTDNGGVYRTTDGMNLLPQEVSADSTLRAVHFVDTLHGWICGDENTILRRHLESGTNVVWSSLSIPQESQTIDWQDIFFLNPKTGWIVGTGGAVYKSTDGGITWTKETTGLFDKLNAIHMVSQSKGWIAGDNGVIMIYTP